MNILFIGTMVTDVVSELCYKKGVKVSAADIAQKYMVAGLQSLDEVAEIDVVGAVRVSSWPKTKIASLKKDIQKTEKGYIFSCPYFNIPVFGFLFRELSLIHCAKKWANKHKHEKDVIVFVYAMSSSGMKAAKAVKDIIPNAKIALTVADLPLIMRTVGKLRKFAKNIDWKQIKRLMKYIDKYMLYTKYMADYLNLEEDQWVLFEGLMDENKIVKDTPSKNNEKICLYAGNLSARYGIDTLIDAFGKVKSKAVLHIYGSGYDTELIKAKIKNMPNVMYMGQVTQEEAFEKMKEATLLINPRPSSLELTKYSCPSKTFEYMASGTPVLMNRLAGLPDEYAQYVIFFEEESSDAYAKAIDGMLSKNQAELSKIGMSAAVFLLNEKCSKKVMEKMLQFITASI